MQDGERLLKVRPASLKGSLLSIAEKVHFLRQAGVPPAPAAQPACHGGGPMRPRPI